MMNNNPRKEWHTPKGTPLPLINLKGKEYLQVQHRLVWFREEHPNWEIITKIVESSPNHVVFQAAIMNEQGKLIATGTKTGLKSGFPAYYEKAETGAVGRALLFCGYGTAFAGEDLEGEDENDVSTFCDSPIDPPAQSRKETPAKSAEYLFDMGDGISYVAYKGKKLSEIPIGFIEQEVKRWSTRGVEKDSKPGRFMIAAIPYIERYNSEHTE